MIILYGLFTCLLIFKVVCLSKLFVKASSHFGVENVCVCVYVYGRGECEFLSLFFFLPLQMCTTSTFYRLDQYLNLI